MTLARFLLWVGAVLVGTGAFLLLFCAAFLLWLAIRGKD